MNCSTIDEAVATVSAAPRCASANFLIAQHDAAGPQALDLEISPNAVATLTGGTAGLVHTNHFLDPETRPGLHERPRPFHHEAFQPCAEPARRTRRDRIRSGNPRAAGAESRADLPYPISRHHNPDPSSSTLAGIIMDLTHNRFILTKGAPHRSVWVDTPGV